MNDRALSTQDKVTRELHGHEQRRAGVPYKLSVIDGSGGMLQLVEEDRRPKAHWFFEWTRAMQFSNYGM